MALKADRVREPGPKPAALMVAKDHDERACETLPTRIHSATLIERLTEAVKHRGDVAGLP